MPVPSDIQAHLDAQRFDAVEDAWLTRLDERPDDAPFFGTVGQALERAGEGDRARLLLEMVDEQLREAARWGARLELLQHAGALLFAAQELHPEILRTLGEIHGHCPSFSRMVDKVGLRRAVDDIPKTWAKAERLASLLAFDVGSIVHLEGKGAGKVTEVNMELESFKVELEAHPELRVGFGGAAKLLRPLAAGHVLRRCLEAPDELRRLAAAEPAELLRIVLESYDQPRTGAEIRRDLAGIVDDKRWTSWWAAARKHPQVLAASGGRHAYSWTASSGHAEDAVWEAFETASPRRRIDLLRQNAERDPQLRARMAAALAAHAGQAVDADPGLACEIWYALERHEALPGDVAWSPAALAVRLTDLEFAALAAGVQDRALRERTYQLAGGKRRDWPGLALRLMSQEAEAKALDVLAAALTPELLGSLLDQLLSQPRKNPAAFTWMVERARDEPEWLRRNPLRLLKQFLWSLTDEGFASFRSRLQPLAESGGTLPRLLDHLSDEQAAQTAAALKKTVALLDYQRHPLLNALYLRFPGLREEEEAPLYATRDAIDAKRDELRRLLEEEIPANRRAIATAREHGDLRENFEYKSARERHAYLSARATALDHDLHRARPIDPSIVKGDEVVIGSRVTFAGDGGRRRTLTILGPWNSKPEEDVLSNESELAQTILGAKLGQAVRLDDGAWRVAAIEPYA